MARSLLALTPLVASVFLHSAVADFTFNTTFNSKNNGEIGNPAEQLKALNATPACLSAYVANIDCDPVLFDLTLDQSETQYTDTNLNKACTTTCEKSLAGWVLNAFDACQNQPAAVTLFNTSQVSPDEYMLMYYRAYCTKDLNNGTFCLTESDPVVLDQASNYTTGEVQAACNDTCWTQNSAVLWKTYGDLNQTSQINSQDVFKVCPNVDTSKYEVLEPLSALNSSGSSSTSSVSSTASTTGSATTTAGSVASKTGSAGTTGSGSSTASSTAAPHTNDAGSVSRAGFSVALLAIAVVALSL